MPAPIPAAGPPPMTAAEFRVTRERLGVSGDWLAWKLGVTERTVRRWENGSTIIPVGVVEDIRQLDARTTVFVTETINALESGERDADGYAWATIYTNEAQFEAALPDLEEPASWHRTALGRVAASLPHLRLRFPQELID